MAQIGGFDSKALSTDSFWSHVGSASDNQWRVTKLRVAWVVQHNPAAIRENSFWALSSSHQAPISGLRLKRASWDGVMRRSAMETELCD